MIRIGLAVCIDIVLKIGQVLGISGTKACLLEELLSRWRRSRGLFKIWLAFSVDSRRQIFSFGLGKLCAPARPDDPACHGFESTTCCREQRSATGDEPRGGSSRARLRARHTSRTRAVSDGARRRALDSLRRVLLIAVAPHEARLGGDGAAGCLVCV